MVDPFERRAYAGGAGEATLAVDPGSTGLSISLVAVPDGWDDLDGASGPFVLTIDPGGSEEKVLCQGRTTTVCDIATLADRGIDGTTAVAHAAGVRVIHSYSAVDADEANNAVVQTIGQVSTKGDLLVATGPNTLARLPAGAANTVLRRNAATATGLEYGAPPAHTHGEGDVTNLTTDLAGKAASGHSHSPPAYAYQDYTPVLAGPVGFAKGNGSLTGRWVQIGKHVVGVIRFAGGTTTSPTAGGGSDVNEITFTLPVAATGRNVHAAMVETAAGERIEATAVTFSDDTGKVSRITFRPTAGPPSVSASRQALGVAAAGSWALVVLTVNFSYETA